MSDLGETLAAINSALPGLPARVTAPHEIGQSLERAVEGFLRDVQQKESSAGQRVDKAQAALATLRDEASQVETLLEGEVEVLESLHREHSQTLDARREALTREVTEARQAMDKLQEHLKAAGQAAQAELDAVKEDVASLERAQDASEQALRTAVDGFEREAELLHVEVQSAEAQVDQRLTELRQLMTRLAEGARDRLRQVAQELDTMGSTHDTALQETGSALSTGQEGLVTALRDGIEKELKEQLSAAAVLAVQALNALGDKADQAAQRTARSRPELESALEKAREEGDSILDVVGQVEKAAEVAGFLWGI